MAMPDFAHTEAVGNQFIQYYYAKFDTNRSELFELFHPAVSIMMFEGQRMIGREAIMTKINGLPFQQIKHIVTTTDIQPTVDDGIIVMVLGQLQTDNDPPHSFSEVFYLKKENPTTYIILNSSFRLSLHNVGT